MTKITADKALIEPSKQPVAWRAKDANGRWMYGDLPVPELPADQPQLLCALLAQVSEPAVEPVVWASQIAIEVASEGGEGIIVAAQKDGLIPLYISPPPKAEVPLLTDAEIERIYLRYGGDMVNCSRAIERAVRHNAGLK